MTEKKPNDIIHLFKSCNSFEEAFDIFKKKTPPKSASLMLEAMALHFEKTASSRELKKVYRRIGDIYTQMSEFNEAIKWYTKAKNLE